MQTDHNCHYPVMDHDPNRHQSCFKFFYASETPNPSKIHKNLSTSQVISKIGKTAPILQW